MQHLELLRERQLEDADLQLGLVLVRAGQQASRVVEGGEVADEEPGAAPLPRLVPCGAGQGEAAESAAELKPSGSSRRVAADAPKTDDILADAEKYMRDED